jgi:MGT family glycosyltransferase
MDQKKKIMVLSPPMAGHVNPICGLIQELCKNKNIEVIFYSDEKYRKVIEKTGAKFRLNEKETFSTVNFSELSSIEIGEIFATLVGFAHDGLPQYLSEVEKEKPDLILYDGFSFAAKYLIQILKARHANGDTKIHMPKFALFAPNFPYNEKMFQEIRQIRKETIWTLLSLPNAFRKQIVLSWYYGIREYNPFHIFQRTDENLNIVGVNPELQPYRDEYDDTFKFVGSFIAEEARKDDLNNDPELKALLNEFDNKPKDQKLIFMSLGSMFHKSQVYEKAFEAFKKFDDYKNRHFKFSQFKIIISAGTSLKIFNEKISSGELDLPKNVLLRASVPQLEVLKRADLFITHCGMNSTLETIKYAVPVIGLPLDFDQPTNALRICDKLSFGIRLDTDAFTPNQLADSIDQVLNNKKYKVNIERMSKIAANYNGAVEGVEILTQYLYQ